MRTFGDVLRHVGFWNEYVEKTARGEKADERQNELPKEQFHTKAQLVSALKRSTEAAAAQLKAGPEPTGRIADLWVSFIAHSSEHYGQLVVYYRLNGLVPPVVAALDRGSRDRDRDRRSARATARQLVPNGIRRRRLIRSTSVAQMTGIEAARLRIRARRPARLDHDRRKARARRARARRSRCRRRCPRSGRPAAMPHGFDDKAVAVIEPERLLLDGEAERVGLVRVVDRGTVHRARQMPSASRTSGQERSREQSLAPPL